MANAAYVESLMGDMDRSLRRALRAVFDYILGNLRFGRPAAGSERCENFQLYPIEGTTPAVANEEFTIEHSLNVAPYMAIQVLDLQGEGSAMVRLRVERLADTKRVYLSSPDTNAPIRLLIEG
jgi:hypothetical protein